MTVTIHMLAGPNAEIAVILAAGRGVRLRPITDHIPKAMIRVGGAPLLERIITDTVEAGIKKVVFVIGHLGEQIKEHFGTGDHWHAEFIYEVQTKLNGTGGALRLAKPHLNRTFLVIFGDSFFDRKAIHAMSVCKWKHGIGVVRVTDPSRYGVVEMQEDGRIVGLEEKPQVPKSNLIIAGLYKFHTDILPYLERLSHSTRGELELPDAVSDLIHAGGEVGGVLFSHMTDIGTLASLEAIQKIAAKASPDSESHV